MHRRYPILNSVRAPLRRWVFRMFRLAVGSDDGRRLLHDATRNAYRPQAETWADLDADDLPYGLPSVEGDVPPRAAPVFLTGRFRSGSTLLWNLFRNVDGCTSYYEPLNERRWFDPSLRGERVDPTHRGVDEYWKEYEGMEFLSRYFQDDWYWRRLLLAEDAWEPDLQRYFEALIERAPQRAVLQCNRIDFRLPWLRRRFPDARILHLYRHPREQWCSSLMDPQNCPPDGTIEQFSKNDGFSLMWWVRDLQLHFPFLDERRFTHPYPLFYLIWRLSYMFGRKYAHRSFAYEDLVSRPDEVLPVLMESASVQKYDLAKLKSLLSPPTREKWRTYADESWYRRHESACEQILAEFLHAGRTSGGTGAESGSAAPPAAAALLRTSC